MHVANGRVLRFQMSSSGSKGLYYMKIIQLGTDQCMCIDITQSWKKNILKGREATAVGLHTGPEIGLFLRLKNGNS